MANPGDFIYYTSFKCNKIFVTYLYNSFQLGIFHPKTLSKKSKSIVSHQMLMFIVPNLMLKCLHKLKT